MNYKSREEYYLFGRLNVLVCSVWESKKVYRATYENQQCFFFTQRMRKFPHYVIDFNWNSFKFRFEVSSAAPS